MALGSGVERDPDDTQGFMGLRQPENAQGHGFGDHDGASLPPAHQQAFDAVQIWLLIGLESR